MPVKGQASLAVPASEKRRERRYPTNDPVEVRAFPFTDAPLPAKILDVSRSGMKLEVETPLAPHMHIEVMMLTSRAVIFGEVRYCRRAGVVHHAGVLIEDVVQSKPETRHLHEDDIDLFAAGKGLNAAEVLRVEEHLSRCANCKARLAERTKTLYPALRRLAPRRDDTL